MCLRKSIGILTLLACIAWPLPAFALMLGLSTEKLTRDAALIVTGDVEDTASQWTADKKFITTTAIVSVQQILKGKYTDKTIPVMYMGGQIGDIVMRQSDVAALHKGEKVLLFLSPEQEYSGGTAHRIVGKAQGSYAIGADLIARKKGFSVEAVDEHMDISCPLDTLLKKIKNHVDEE